MATEQAEPTVMGIDDLNLDMPPAPRPVVVWNGEDARLVLCHRVTRRCGKWVWVREFQFEKLSFDTMRQPAWLPSDSPTRQFYERVAGLLGHGMSIAEETA